MLKNPENLPYGKPYDWDDLSLEQQFEIIVHQLATFAWWLRVHSKPFVV